MNELLLKLVNIAIPHLISEYNISDYKDKGSISTNVKFHTKIRKKVLNWVLLKLITKMYSMPD